MQSILLFKKALAPFESVCVPRFTVGVSQVGLHGLEDPANARQNEHEPNFGRNPMNPGIGSCEREDKHADGADDTTGGTVVETNLGNGMTTMFLGRLVVQV